MMRVYFYYRVRRVASPNYEAGKRQVWKAWGRESLGRVFHGRIWNPESNGQARNKKMNIPVSNGNRQSETRNAAILPHVYSAPQ